MSDAEIIFCAIVVLLKVAVTAVFVVGTVWLFTSLLDWLLSWLGDDR